MSMTLNNAGKHLLHEGSERIRLRRNLAIAAIGVGYLLFGLLCFFAGLRFAGGEIADLIALLSLGAVPSGCGLLCFWIADVGATATLLRSRPSGEYRFYAAEMLLSVSAGAGGAALLLYCAAVSCAAELLPCARICAGGALLSLGAAIGLQKSAKKCRGEKAEKR